MLSKSQITAASRTLHDHSRAGTKLGGLDEALRPRNRAEAYAVQGKIQNYSKAKLFGWKIAATSEAGQKHINVGGPMAGRILSETVIPDGGTASRRETRCASPSPNSPFAWRPICRRVRSPIRCGGCWTRSARCIRRSRFEFAVRRFRQRGNRADHRGQCLRAFVCAGSTDDGGLARARSRRGKACDRDAGKAVHRSWQERARRSPDRLDLARRRIATARPDAAGRRGGDNRHLPSTAANPVRRCLRG